MRLSDIDLRLLRVFKAVADTGGFVKAQIVLGISQPAISSHIANLEQRLNVRLCNRGPQGFSLTRDGQMVLEETDSLLIHLDAYANRLNEIGKTANQRVMIGVVDCLVTDPANPMPAAISSARSKFKDLRIGVGVYDYLDCMTELRAGRLDIALVGIEVGDQVPDDIEAKHVYDEVSGLFCSPDHPCGTESDLEKLSALLKKAEISAHSFLSNPIDESLNIHLLDETAHISQGNIESTVYLTLAGTHVGVIPVHYADQWVKKGALIPVASEVYTVISQFHVVHLKSNSLKEVCQHIWNELSGASGT